MPNWCYNNLTVTHKDPTRVQAAIDAFHHGKFFEHFVPMPGEWQYDWCISNWGTKWDVGDNDAENCELLDPNTVYFRFDSAWSPPIEVYRAMAAQGFEVEAYYQEIGMAFVGKVVADEDSFIEDYREYAGETSKTVRAVIGEELDDYFEISAMMEQWEEDDSEEERLSSLPPHTD